MSRTSLFYLSLPHTQKEHSNMNFKLSGATLLLLSFVYPALSFAQFSKGMNYKVEAESVFSGGDYAPFWLTANRNGLSSVKNNNGYLRAGIFRPVEKEKKLSYALGLDLAVAYHFTSTFIVQQAYADLKYSFLELSVGSKERNPELKNPFLSIGGMTLSNNARPIPQVRISVPDYVIIPGTKGLFALKGHLAYGMFTDDGWQKDFAKPGSKYTEHVLYHSKALFARIGNENIFPLVFEGGLEMAAQFGGNAFNSSYNLPFVDMPNGIKDFFKVLIPSGGDSSTPGGEQSNIYGNHVGSWNFSLSYAFPDWKIRGYYEHFFEDHSQMFGQYGWKDCLVGVEFTLPSNPFVGKVVYEYMGTKDQSGPVFHDKTSIIPDQISAVDDYYNHYIYTGWQHWGMGIGNPLLLSPVYNKDGLITFKSNRIKSHHIGISGNPGNGWEYRMLLTYVRHWGTYFDPFDEIKKSFNSLLEVTYAPKCLKGWKFKGAVAFDGGDLVGHNCGGMLTISKTGLLSK